MELFQVDITTELIISGMVLVLLGIFYLYRIENRWIMGFVVSQFRPGKAELKKDTRGRDWLVLMVLLVVVVILYVKIVTPMVILSNSMKPEFERGDIILSQSFFMKPEKGDIITFNVRNRQTAVTHRVDSITETGIIKTKGDNNGYIDDFMTTEEDITAKAIIVNEHPIVLKGAGAFFITDYSKEGVIYRFGDRFTFMQQLSATIKAWGYVLTVVSILGYILIMKKENKIYGGR